MSSAFHKLWLKITAIIVGSFGPIFVLGAAPETSEAARFTLDVLSWPLDGATTYASADTRFLSALAGGFLVGWGVTIWCLSSYVYDLAPDGVRKSVVYGALAWFVFDSAGSVVSGNAINALFNLIFLMLAVGPLWWQAKPNTHIEEG